MTDAHASKPEMDAMNVARRIKSRFARIEGAYAAGPIANGRDGLVDLITGGRTYRAYVKQLREQDRPRPAGFDHIMGKRPRIDPLMLAELASRHVGGMARISKSDEAVGQLDVWHKAGTAGFVATARDGTRFLVEVSEVTPMQQLEEAGAAVAAMEAQGA